MRWKERKKENPGEDTHCDDQGARSLTSAIKCAKLGIFQWLKRGEMKERNDDAGRLQKADQCPNVFALGCCTLVSRRSPAHIFFSNTATALLGAN